MLLYEALLGNCVVKRGGRDRYIVCALNLLSGVWWVGGLVVGGWIGGGEWCRVGFMVVSWIGGGVLVVVGCDGVLDWWGEGGWVGMVWWVSGGRGEWVGGGSWSVRVGSVDGGM